MAYQTGAATGLLDLTAQLKAFLEANGATVNRYDTDGAGKRLQVRIGADTYVNLKALNNESHPVIPGAFDTAVHTGLFGTLSTGYDATKDWYNQPGAASPYNPNLFDTGGVSKLYGSIPSYHFFLHDEMVYVWVESSAGVYQFIVFGKLSTLR